MRYFNRCYSIDVTFSVKPVKKGVNFPENSTNSLGVKELAGIIGLLVTSPTSAATLNGPRTRYYDSHQSGRLPRPLTTKGFTGSHFSMPWLHSVVSDNTNYPT